MRNTCWLSFKFGVFKLVESYYDEIEMVVDALIFFLCGTDYGILLVINVSY